LPRPIPTVMLISHKRATCRTTIWYGLHISSCFPSSPNKLQQDPAVVDSVQFGQLWKVSFNAKEQFYAKPLVFTPAASGVQILFLASSQNYIRTLNAKTGAILNTRQVHTPFLQSDIGCTDIPNTIGIIGTPVIDPVTEIAYFFSKTYISTTV
jgi:iron transport multicopper oxidase